MPIIDDTRLNEYGFRVEDWVNLQNRVNNCIDDILKKYDDNDMIICVTSGVNIVSFINKAYGLPASSNTPFLDKTLQIFLHRI